MDLHTIIAEVVDYQTEEILYTTSRDVDRDSFRYNEAINRRDIQRELEVFMSDLPKYDRHGDIDSINNLDFGNPREQAVEIMEGNYLLRAYSTPITEEVPDV